MQSKNPQFPITWEQVHRDAKNLALKLKNTHEFEAIIAVCRGGLVPAAIIARELNINLIDTICLEQGEESEILLKKPCIQDKKILVIDDIVKTGNTMQKIKEFFPHAHFASLYVKTSGKNFVDTFITEVSQDTWILFPWQTNQ